MGYTFRLNSVQWSLGRVQVVHQKRVNAQNLITHQVCINIDHFTGYSLHFSEGPKWHQLLSTALQHQFHLHQLPTSVL